MEPWLKNIIDELVVRVIYGPMHFRLIMQPLMATLLGIRDGKRDAKAGLPPFLWGFVSGAGGRMARFKHVAWRLRVPIAIATLLDGVVQFLMFQHVRPLMALLLGSSLMGLPYSIARSLSNRFHSRRQSRQMQMAPHDGAAGGRM